MISLFWTNLSEAQATLMNGLFTLVAAVAGVLIGARLFGNKITNITDAIDASQAAVNAHLETMDKTLSLVNERAEGLNEVLSAITDRLGRAAVIEADAAADAEAEHAAPEPSHDNREPEPPHAEAQANEPTREEIRKLWNQMAERLEAIASNPEIDGRTRAKYVRIDRRAYGDLIAALRHKDEITAEAADAAQQAYSLRNSFRSRKAEPTHAELERMARWRDVVLDTPPAHALAT